MTIFRKLFSGFLAYFHSKEASKVLSAFVDQVPKVIPYIDWGFKFIAKRTPSDIDDMALAFFHVQFPRLFDGSITDMAELKRYVGEAITRYVEIKFGMTTNPARALVELALFAWKQKAQKMKDQALPAPPASPSTSSISSVLPSA